MPPIKACHSIRAPRVDPSEALWRALLTPPLFSTPEAMEELAAKAQALILAGADPEQERPNPLNPAGAWRTPLALALRNKWEPVALALIPFCDPLRLCRQSQGCDLLMDACFQPLAIQALLDRGADPLRVDELGRSALMYALRFDTSAPASDGLRASVRLLLPVSDPNAVDLDGETLEDWAAKSARGPIASEIGALRARREAERLAQTIGSPPLKPSPLKPRL